MLDEVASSDSSGSPMKRKRKKNPSIRSRVSLGPKDLNSLRARHPSILNRPTRAESPSMLVLILREGKKTRCRVGPVPKSLGMKLKLTPRRIEPSTVTK